MDVVDLISRLKLDVSDFQRKLTQIQKEYQSSFGQMDKSAKKTSKDMSKSMEDYSKRSSRAAERVEKSWWKTFGRVAVGFTIAYRAMNAFERSVQELTGTIKESIVESGELASIQAKLAFWYQVHSEEMVNYNKAFEQAAVNVNALAKASLTSVSSLSELSTGLDEVSQAIGAMGPEMIPKLADVVDYTVMVAQTTGSTVRQIRQELQALMEGQMRTTNILLRSMKNLNVLTEEDISNLKAMTNRAEIFEKVLSAISEHWTEVKEKLISTDVSIAFKYWEKSIRLGLTYATQYASRIEETGNIFAEEFAKRADDAAMSLIGVSDEMKRHIILMQKLRDALSLGLDLYHGMISAVGKAATAMDNLSKPLSYVVKALGAYVGVSAIDKFGKALLWLARKPLKMTIRMMNALYTRVLAVPAVLTAVMISTEVLIDMLNEKFPDVGDKVKGTGDKIKGTWDKVADSTKEFTHGLIDMKYTLDLLTGVWSLWSGTAPAWDVISDAWSFWGEKAGNVFTKENVKTLTDKAEDAGEAVSDSFLGEFVTRMGKKAGSHAEVLKSLLKPMLDEMGKVLSDLFEPDIEVPFEDPYSFFAEGTEGLATTMRDNAEITSKQAEKIKDEIRDINYLFALEIARNEGLWRNYSFTVQEAAKLVYDAKGDLFPWEETTEFKTVLLGTEEAIAATNTAIMKMQKEIQDAVDSIDLSIEALTALRNIYEDMQDAGKEYWDTVDTLIDLQAEKYGQLGIAEVTITEWAENEKEKIRQKYWQNQRQMELDAASTMVDNISYIYEEASKYSKSAFETLKALRKMETLITGAQGVLEAYVWAYKYTGTAAPYVGTAMAATVAAMTSAKLATIEAQEYASGGWLDRNPKGGKINEGSGNADDVFLGATPGVAHWGMKGEQVFILNKEAVEKYGALLESLNQETYAKGGWVNRGYGILSDVVRGATNIISAPFEAIGKAIMPDFEMPEVKAAITFDEVIHEIDIMLGVFGDLDKELNNTNKQFDSWIEQLEESGATTKELELIEQKRAEVLEDLIEAEEQSIEKGLVDKLLTIVAPERLKELNILRDFADTIEEIRELKDITDEGYNELISLAVEAYSQELTQTESIDDLTSTLEDWTQLVENLGNQILDLQTSLANPADIFEQMGSLASEISDYLGEDWLSGVIDASDLTAEEIDVVRNLLGDYLSLGQEAWQRPSNEYQALYDVILGNLGELQDIAENNVSMYDMESAQTVFLSGIFDRLGDEGTIAEELSSIFDQLGDEGTIAERLSSIADQILEGSEVIIDPLEGISDSLPDVTESISEPAPEPTPEPEPEPEPESEIVLTNLEKFEQIAAPLNMPVIDLRDWYTMFRHPIDWEALKAEVERRTEYNASNARFQFGGLATGPESGYSTTLHGTELITPWEKVQEMFSLNGGTYNLSFVVNESRSARETAKEIRTEIEAFMRSSKGGKLVQKRARSKA